MPEFQIAGRPLRLPVIGAPMFIVSGVDLVIAQCKAGIVGAFPALNARGDGRLDDWIGRITAALAEHDARHPDRPAAPFAVNQILHPSNTRADADLAVCVAHRVPIVITSLQISAHVVEAVHGYGGIVLHDVINTRHAQKALEAGVDGLIAVCAGAGGHAGRLSPFALVEELRAVFDGPLAVSGAISTGGGVAAALAMGADYAYLGTRFIAATEANAVPDYKRAVVAAGAEQIVYTSLITGVPANFLRSSLEAAGLDPDNLPGADKSKMTFGSGGNMEHRAWRDIWGAGQSVAGVRRIETTAAIVDGLEAGFRAACARLSRG